MARPVRTIGDLARLVGGAVLGDPNVPVPDVSHDSRAVSSRGMFAALVGQNRDGHDFIDQAIASGAGSLCLERSLDPSVPQLLVDDTRRILGPLASAVHRDPSESLRVIGVTGTNGKTTVSHYVDWLVRSAGISSGILGTIGIRIGNTDIETIRTTPEATDFQRLLAQMVDGGIRVVATEVSSHALALDRVRGTRFAVAAFTNLSQDHLDFHGDMESYRKAKESLFSEYQVDLAVINTDDPTGKRLSEAFDGQVLKVGRGGDIGSDKVSLAPEFSTFEVTMPHGHGLVRSPVVGRFNVDNAVMAAAIGYGLGLEFEQILGGLESLPVVPGRYELIRAPGRPAVVVDYAHTPDGITNAISAARDSSSGRVIAVIGAGGDRDRGKRPLMGQAAASADLVIVTNDNPRSESPEEIAASVLTGVPDRSRALIELDRRLAIKTALDVSDVDDIVLILGKGHESGQEVGGRILPFDDRRVVRELLGLERVEQSDPGSSK